MESFGIVGGFRMLLPEVEWVTGATSTADQTSYTFGPYDLPAGLCVVAAASRNASGNNRQITSITIGGVAATLHENPSGSVNAVAVGSRRVAAGSQSIVVSHSPGATNRCGIGVWNITRNRSDTPIDSYANNGTSPSSASSADVPMTFPGGVAVYGLIQGLSSLDTTWSSARERFDVSAETRFSFADKPSLIGSSHTETASWGSNQVYGIVGASWR